MKTLTTTALVALMTTTLALPAVPAQAQEAAPAQIERQHGPGLHLRHHDRGPRHMGRMGGTGFLGFLGNEEAVEVALVRLSHRIELTAGQQPLFDTLKTAALAAAADFASAAEGLRPEDGETTLDFAERLDNHIAIQAAHLAALEAIQPAATAFFESLTDDQQSRLTSDRRGRFGGPRWN